VTPTARVGNTVGPAGARL